MEPWTSIVTTAIGDLLVLAAAVINLAAATRPRPRPGKSRRRQRH
jgi:hypothetical protein